MVREREVKILDIDVKKLEEKIISCGGIFICEEWQDNYIIDSTNHPINNTNQGYLRIRSFREKKEDKNKHILTFKLKKSDNILREYNEYSTFVDDLKSALKIFELLGYDKQKLSKKYRRSFKLMDARIDIDEWDENTYPEPYAEIEVKDENELEQVVKILSIKKEQISTKSILELQKLKGIE